MYPSEKHPFKRDYYLGRTPFKGYIDTLIPTKEEINIYQTSSFDDLLAYISFPGRKVTKGILMALYNHPWNIDNGYVYHTEDNELIPTDLEKVTAMNIAKNKSLEGEEVAEMSDPFWLSLLLYMNFELSEVMANEIVTALSKYVYYGQSAMKVFCSLVDLKRFNDSLEHNLTRLNIMNKRVPEEIKKLCACHLPDSEYTKYSKWIANLPACDPVCLYPNAVKSENSCDDSFCAINAFSIDGNNIEVSGREICKGLNPEQPSKCLVNLDDAKKFKIKIDCDVCFKADDSNKYNPEVIECPDYIGLTETRNWIIIGGAAIIIIAAVFLLYKIKH